MTCHNCRIEMVKAGFYGRTKIQRYKCQQCGKRFAEPQQKPFGANGRLPQEKVEMILHCHSVRSTARLCDVEKRTVLNILKLAGDNSTPQKCHCLIYKSSSEATPALKRVAVGETTPIT